MSVFITTHSNKKNRESINNLVGKAYNLWDRIQMGGIGSPRLMVEEVSMQLDMVMNKRTQVNYASIELRPKGIIMHFTKGVQSFAWVIPYYRLSIFTGDQMTIHGAGNFARLRRDNRNQSVHQFILKLLKEKGKFMTD